MIPTPLAPHRLAASETLADTYFLFTLGQEAFAIPSSRVQEIFLAPDEAPTPHPAGHHRATVTLRGQTVPVIDLRRRGGRGDGFVIQARAALGNGGYGVVGLMVDDATGVADVAEDQIEAPSRFGERPGHLLGVAKVNDRITALLDLDRIAFGDDLDDLE